MNTLLIVSFANVACGTGCGRCRTLCSRDHPRRRRCRSEGCSLQSPGRSVIFRYFLRHLAICKDLWVGHLYPGGVFMVVAGPAAVSSTQPTQCSSGQPQEFSGKVAVIDRGDCPFADKVCRAQLNGAVAAIVVNNVDGSPSTMGGSSRCMKYFGRISRAYSTSAQVLHNFYPFGDDLKGGWSHSKIEAACHRFG
jgi:hypothetical protein